MQDDVLLWQGFASLKKLSEALTSPLNCLRFHGCKNKNKNTFFSPLIWEARSRGRCRTGPHWRTVLRWETLTLQVLSEKANWLACDAAWGPPGPVSPAITMPRCLSSIKDFLWVFRTQIYGELCVHLRWNHRCGGESLPFYLLLSEAGPSRAKFMAYYLVCLVHRKMT